MKKKLLLIPTILVLLIGGYLVLDNLLFTGIRPIEIKEDGIQGSYFAPPDAKDRAAIIIIGGGAGGDYWGQELAKRGYAGLSLPYYRQPGLPPLQEEIPLEYFEQAINWLRQQAAVDPSKVMLMGASRNAELALLIASQFPDLISGVIAFAPSAISWPNAVLPYNSDTLLPSWTYQDQAIPYIPMPKIAGSNSSTIQTLPYWMAGIEKANQYEEAFIPVENIKGPILLLSGIDDQIWPASLMGDMITERLDTLNFQYEVEHLQFEKAGHLISRNLANVREGRTGQMEIDGKSYALDFGGTIEGDSLAIVKSGEKIWAFLERVQSR
ncbi:MAG: acyl-CoA thioester hydrolase/BAAT C-terminal domain-containing protein [Bacteroidota bacterium]